jgi:hypothetical protein
MERVDNIRREPHDLIRASYQDGLRRVFDVCHDPLPERMAYLLQALDDNEGGASHSMK